MCSRTSGRLGSPGLAAGLSELSIATTRSTRLQPEMGQWSEPTCLANRQPHATRAQTRARSAHRCRRRTTRRAGRLPVAEASVGARRVARMCALRVGLLRYVSCGSAAPRFFSSLYTRPLQPDRYRSYPPKSRTQPCRVADNEGSLSRPTLRQSPLPSCTTGILTINL